MANVIIYKTKYGSTKQYAQWLQEEIGGDILDDKALKKFNDYNTVIFGSCVYIGNIKIAKYIKKNWEQLKNKNIVLFTVSGATANSKDIKKWYENSLPKNMRKNIKFFSLNGQTIWTDLSPIHKLMVKIIKKRTGDFGKINKEELKPIINFIKNGM